MTDSQPLQATLQLPNGATVLIAHTCTLVLNDYITLTNVFCVPLFAFNFFSIFKLLKNNDLQVKFLGDKCYIQDQVWMKKVEIGKVENGLNISQASDNLSAKTTG